MTQEQIKASSRKIPIQLALKSAFDVCFLVSDHLANVIGSGEANEGDYENKNSADTYIEWYTQLCNRSDTTKHP